MFNCESMGISIGENTIAQLERNVIVDCMGGIQVHSDAIAYVINNTFYNNEVGVRCYHNDNSSNTGGSAFVVNTIFSQCDVDYAVQSNSQLEITYSLSDKELHNGIGNIYDNPQFVNISDNNFELSDFSPCIDAGDLLSVPDPDGTRADIGAIPFNQNASITEFSSPILVYPNPYSGRFTVKLDSNLIESIDIYDLTGKNIYKKTNIKSIDYIVEIETKGLILVLISDNKGTKYFTKLVQK